MITTHSPRSRMPRHRHDGGYLAIVVSGGFLEAGSGPRVEARAGSMIVHEDWEAHQDSFSARGARVLNLPKPASAGESVSGALADLDAVARLAEQNPLAAASLALELFTSDDPPIRDWPDLLARDLAEARPASLQAWASEHGLALPSVSRGFRKAFGVSPQRYRHELSLKRALAKLATWPDSIASLAAELGFADQAHLTRGIVAVTGQTPSRLKARFNPNFRI